MNPFVKNSLFVFYIGATCMAGAQANDAMVSGAPRKEAQPAAVVTKVAKPAVKPAAKAAAQVVYSGTMIPTVYNKPFYNLDEPSEQLEKTCNAKSTMKTFVDTKGNILLKEVCLSVYMNCVMQGTCTILKGDQIYTLKRVGEQLTKKGKPKSIFIIDDSACEFGYGSARICLVPYKSIAVDPKKQKYNSVVYVPSLKKSDENGKMIHDGCFIAHDAGGSIKGYGRFDIFIGDDDYKEPDNEYISHFVKNSVQGKKRIPFINLTDKKAKEICTATDFNFKKPY